MRFCLFSIIALLAVLISAPVSADIVINEYMSGNQHGIEDEDGDREDWIELYNNGDSTINLLGYGLTDDPEDPFKWTFPTRNLAPGAFRIIFASGKNRYGGEFHTNFQIQIEGETLCLYNNEGELLDQQFTGLLAPDVSRGRQGDGCPDWYYFSEPTPYQSNISTPFDGIADRPIFLSPGGIHSGPASVQLMAAPGDDIRFTLDGAVPLLLSSVYTAPFDVDTTTTVRARAFRAGYIPSPVATRSFVVDEPINLPVVCLTLDPPDLWDWVFGIYVMGDSAETDWPYYGANFWEDWEKSGHVEFFEVDGAQALSQDVGVTIHGGYSRPYPQKSLRLIARDKYFASEFEYPCFPDRPVIQFKRLILRNTGQDFPYAHCRDVVAHELARSTDLERMATRASMLFLNGVYWGYMNLRERIDKFYLEDYFGVDPNEMDILNSEWDVVEGNATHWANMIEFIESHDMADEDNYRYVQTLMDTENFAEYNAFNIYLAHTDWPDHNIRRWRPRSPDGRWRWFFFDLDMSLGAGLGNAEHNTLDMASNPDEEAWGIPYWATMVFGNLLDSEDFRHRFLNFSADHMNGCFRPENAQAVLDSVVASIAAEVPRHKDRWDISGDWEGRLAFIRNFINDRPHFAKQHLMERFEIPDTLRLSLDVSPPGAGQIELAALEIEASWSGIYFAGIPIQLKAMPNPGFTFDGWSDLQLPSNPSIEITSDSDTSLTVFFRPAAYGGAWAVINEINYHSHGAFDPGDWVELHNPGDVDLELGGWQFKDAEHDHSFLFPHDLVLPGGGYVVLCEDLDSFILLFPEVENVLGETGFGFSGGGEILRLYDDENMLADAVAYDDDAPWPPEPDGGGPTLELINPYEDNSQPDNWAASLAHAEHGTPGAVNSVFLATALPAEESAPGLHFLRPYPYPFNPSCTLRFHVPRAGKVRLDIFDIRGRRVDSLLDEKREAGWHSLVWQPEDLGSGVYLARIDAAERVLSRKLILLK